MKMQEQALSPEKEQGIAEITEDVIALLKTMIAIPSFSREEDGTAAVICAFLEARNIPFQRKRNNVWAFNKHYDPAKPSILINSHHDTVKPNAGYTRDPFQPGVEDGKLFGLGSNDAGGALVTMLGCFLHFYGEKMNYNLIYAATAEEEISGANGVEIVLPEFGNVEFGIVGEPTGMHLAIAEKGLMVLDCKAHGVSGHAAREDGENAIYKAMKDIEWFRTYQFPEHSETLGPIKMSVTMIHSGTQHNVIPDTCEFTVDVRTTEAYTNEEILDTIRQHVSSDVTPRSNRLRSSGISKEHPLVKAGLALKREMYGSPTTSDKALMRFPTLKMGPGHSSRSHSADEFIYLEELREAVPIYVAMLNKVVY